MQVIFLDIDGVLTCDRVNHSLMGQEKILAWRKFDPIALDFFNSIQVKFIRSLRFVVSSAWRTHFGERITTALRTGGFIGAFIPGYEATPVLGGKRGVEINTWLNRAKESNIDIFNYIIIDQEGQDFLPEQHPHLVLTTESNGLLAENMLDILNRIRGNINV